MPVCHYCHYQIKEFSLNDDDPGDEYMITSIARDFVVDGVPCQESMEIAVCEACIQDKVA